MPYAEAFETVTGKRLAAECPTCRLGWFLFPPVKIDGENKVRCVECKDVFASDHPAVVQAQPPT